MPSDPGTQGTPAAFIDSMAETLSPIKRMVCGSGPIKTKPLSCTRSAKSAFSERNPYPGWIATASVISAAAIMAGILR